MANCLDASQTLTVTTTAGPWVENIYSSLLFANLSPLCNVFLKLHSARSVLVVLVLTGVPWLVQKWQQQKIWKWSTENNKKCFHSERTIWWLLRRKLKGVILEILENTKRGRGWRQCVEKRPKTHLKNILGFSPFPPPHTVTPVFQSKCYQTSNQPTKSTSSAQMLPSPEQPLS